jgi:signal transduction histidine kinase/CheY-like chemotaxis protein
MIHTHERRLAQLVSLQRVGEAVARADSLADILEAALDGLVDGVGADRASILLFDPDGVMRFKAWRGLSDGYRSAVEGHTPWRPEDSDAAPITVPDVAVDPSLTAFHATFAAEGIAALAFVPLLHQGRVLGKFMLYYGAPHGFGDDELGVVEAFARQVALAIERQASATALRESEARWRALARTGAAFASALEIAKALEEVVGSVVPALSDFAIVHLTDGDGGLRQAAQAHVDPHLEEVLVAIGQRYVPSRNPGSVLSRVFGTGQATYVADSAAGLPALDLDPAMRDLVQRLEPATQVVVVLVARGRTLGTLTLGMGKASGRSFTAADVPFAEELARRAALAIDNAALYEELRANDRRKDEFLAMLAHELRNPLAAIVASTQLLGAGGNGDPARRERALAILERQALHMARLTDDLLDVSRFTRGKIELRRAPVELAQLVRQVASGFDGQVERGGYLFAVEVPPGELWLDADTARLEQVVSNLVANALKFTPPGGKIGISLRREGDEALLEVRDSGVGIEPDFLPRIFDLFAQDDRSLARSAGGLGIGLTLVRTLVELHGGKVRAASGGPGQGSRFTVRLPLASVAEQPIVASATGEGNSRRVLLVEDGVDAAEALAELLRHWGHQVAVAGDAPTALALAPGFAPDVVLLDLGLPGMDGHELARHLRQLPALRSALLVALTGYGQQRDRERSAAVGIDHHLVKPVLPEVLRDLLAARAAATRTA